jgi:hypothetical protein
VLAADGPYWHTTLRVTHPLPTDNTQTVIPSLPSLIRHL